MAEYFTGRSRIVSITATTQAVGQRAGASAGFTGKSTAAGWGCALAAPSPYTKSFGTTIVSQTPGPPVEYTYFYWVELDAQVRMSAGTAEATATVHLRVESPHFSGTNYPGALVPDVRQSSRLDAEATFTCQMQEYVSDTTAPLYERLVQVSGSVSLAGIVHLWVHPDLTDVNGHKWNLDQVFNVSGSKTLPATAVNILFLGGVATEGLTYIHRLDLEAANTSVSASFVPSGPGLAYSGGTSLFHPGGGSLTATATSATLIGPTSNPPPGNPYTLGIAGVAVSPEWSVGYNITNQHYETGDPETVETVLWCGKNQLGSTTGTHRLPASGSAAYLRASLQHAWGAFGGQFVQYKNHQRLFNPYPDKDATGRLHVTVHPDWGDSYGTLARSWNFAFGTTDLGGGNLQFTTAGEFYAWHLGPQFEAARLQVDSEHLFDLFETDTLWSDPQSRLSLDGGALKFSLAGYVEGTTPGFAAPNPQTDLALWQFKPFGYRYYRFQAKSDVAGRTFTLVVDRRISGSGGNLYKWRFRVDEADTWEEKQLDLAFPDEIYSYQFQQGLVVGVLAQTRTVLHPNSFGAPAVGIIGLTASAEGDGFLWLQDFTGYLKTAGNRTALRLLGPHSAGNSQFPDPTYADFCLPIGTVNREPGVLPGGTLAYLLVVNGVQGYRFTSGNQPVETDWTNYRTALADGQGTPANDTGITITLGDHPWRGKIAQGWSGYWVTGGQPLFRAFAPSTEISIQAVARQYTYGYYGHGDFPGGSYGSHLVFTGEKVWDGEIIGLAYSGAEPVGSTGKTASGASKPGIGFTLHDHDTGDELDSATSDDDGLVRLHEKYGVILPYSNPLFVDDTEIDCTARKQHSTAPIPPVGAQFSITYTTLGKLLNAYWVKSEHFRKKDGEGYSAAGTQLYLDAESKRDKFPILDRWPYWFDFPAGGVFDHPCLLRDYTRRLLVFLTNESGHLIVRVFNRPESGHQEVTIDANPDCKQPIFYLTDTVIEGVYLRGQEPKLARSREHGNGWEVLDLPGNYDAITGALHRKRWVVLGYRDNTWYVRVGLKQPGAAVTTYAWSNEVAISTLTDPDKAGMLRTREDGVLEFLWLNTSGEPTIVRCHSLANDGTGDWI